MPYKNDEKRRKYMRNYMKKRRAKVDDLERRVKVLENLFYGKKKGFKKRERQRKR